MKIADILEHQNIQEGPLDTIGTAVGKTVGGVAKAAGAVAGGVAGIGTAVKKGYQAGKATVGGTSAPQAKAGNTMKRAAGTPGAPDDFKQAAKSGSKIKKIGSKIKQAGKDGFGAFQDKADAEWGAGDKQNPFEVIKTLNREQKQKLYNML